MEVRQDETGSSCSPWMTLATGAGWGLFDGASVMTVRFGTFKTGGFELWTLRSGCLTHSRSLPATDKVDPDPLLRNNAQSQGANLPPRNRSYQDSCVASSSPSQFYNEPYTEISVDAFAQLLSTHVKSICAESWKTVQAASRATEKPYEGLLREGLECHHLLLFIVSSELIWL